MLGAGLAGLAVALVVPAAVVPAGLVEPVAVAVELVVAGLLAGPEAVAGQTAAVGRPGTTST